ERDCNIDILRIVRRFGQKLGVWKKTVFVEHAFLVPNTNVPAELFQRKTEGELTAKRVTIRSNVAENGEPPIVAQSLPDLIELGGAHSCFSLSASICCKISTTREPRAIDSSR